VYKTHTGGEIVGFTSLGDINDFIQLDQEGKQQRFKTASHNIGASLRGIMFHLNISYAHSLALEPQVIFCFR